MQTLVEMRERQAELVAEAREFFDQITDDIDEARAKELEASYDKAMAEHDRIEALAQRAERLAETEAVINEPDPRRPKGDDMRVSAESVEIKYEDVFNTFLRHGNEGLSPEQRLVLRNGHDPEVRAQSVGTTTAGGFLVPQGFVAELIKVMQMWGPMLDPGITRQLVTGTGQQLDWPSMTDVANVGALLAENTQDSEQDLAFTNKNLDAYKYTSKLIRVSEELLQDDAIDIEAIIRDAFAERLGRIVNTHLTTGTGSAQPNGVVTGSAAGVTAAAAAAITFNEMIDLVHSVDPAYRTANNVRFMFNDTTLALLRKLKDGNGAYIWQQSDVRSAEPSTILGFPYSINQAMASPASSAKSVLFGDFNKYVVRRVREMSLKRLVERYADFHQVAFVAIGRWDGEILDSTAIKHLVQAT